MPLEICLCNMSLNISSGDVFHNVFRIVLGMSWGDVLGADFGVVLGRLRGCLSICFWTCLWKCLVREGILRNIFVQVFFFYVLRGCLWECFWSCICLHSGSWFLSGWNNCPKTESSESTTTAQKNTTNNHVLGTSASWLSFCGSGPGKTKHRVSHNHIFDFRAGKKPESCLPASGCELKTGGPAVWPAQGPAPAWPGRVGSTVCWGAKEGVKG